MTKKLLLAASAVAAMAFAGGAAAQVRITSAEVSNVTLTTAPAAGSSATSFTLAAESNGTVGNRNTTTTLADNFIASELPTSGTTVFEPGATGTNYTATLTLTGATFQTSVANTAVQVTGASGACTAPTASVVSGGGVGQSSVTVVFNVPTSCSVATAPTGVTFQTPFTKDAGNSGVSASVNYTVATTGAAYGGGAGSANLVNIANAYEVAVRSQRVVAGAFATSLPTLFALPSYTALATGSDVDNVIGAVSAANTVAGAGAAGGAIYANMAGAALPAITANVSVSGNLAVLSPSLAAAPAGSLVANADRTAAATASDVALVRQNITVSKTGGAAVTAPQTFSATVTPVLATNTLVNTPAAVTASLETVGQQGTNFLAAWVQSTNPTFNTVLRIANGGSAIGAVTLTLQSPISAASRSVCTSAELPKLASVPANGELALNSADFTTCFGNFTRGDIRVTVPALSDRLSAKIRIVNPGGVVTEQSLGGIAAGAAIVN